MYLKRLESVGFKSFAERISVDFVPGVTAVVGPNGSGKSNVTDAIRWVLGEQSAKSLRGSKMEDIIFQGSDTRKPLNVAEVTLVLDNEARTLPIDYHEVSVTRRVYRSGDSEFFLNKQPCRLKDIIDLFLDSGLGREAFSIISQGKVEEILSSKAEERRTIFEEAAGVLKYKNRKKKAEYKLAETQENLNRVEDIIYEIEGQLDPLEQQSSIAKDYLSKKEQLTQTEIALLNAEIVELHDQWQAHLTEIEQLKEKEQQFSVQLQKEGAKVEEEEVQLEQIDQAIEADQQQLLHITESLEKLTGEKNVLLERAKYTAENKEKLEQDLSGLQDNRLALQQQVAKEVGKLSDINQEKTKTEQLLKQAKEQLKVDVDTIEREIESRKADYIELLNDQATTKHSIQAITQQLKQLDERFTVFKEKREDQSEEHERLIAKEQQLLLEAEQCSDNTKQLEDQLEAKQNQLAIGEQDLADMRIKLEQGNRHIDKISSRKEMLEEMKDEFQGFFQGVKAVLKARDHNKLERVHGALIELIKIPTQYTAALETALGGQAQHVIVEDERDGRAAIQFLKETSQGRATFLPLKTMKPKTLPLSLIRKIEGHSGFVTLANQAVEVNSIYQVIIDYLLGHTIIAKTLKDANQIAALTERRYRVVTLEGDVVNPGGSMTGGARKSSGQSLFTRDQELDNLAKKLAEYQERATRFTEKIEQQEQHVFALRTDIKALTNQIQEQQDQFHQVNSQLQACRIRLKHYTDQLHVFEQDQLQVQAERDQLESKKAEHEALLAQLAHSIEQTQDQVEQLNVQKQDFDQNQAQLRAQAQSLEISWAEQKKELTHQDEKVTQLKHQLTEVETSVSKLKQELAEIEQLEKGISQIDQLDEKLLLYQEEKEQVTLSIQDKRKQRLQLTTLLTEREDSLKTVRNQRQAIIEQRQNIEVKANRLDVELENRLTHLQEEYEMSFEKAQQLYPKAEDIKQARQEVKLIKRAISELGTINLGAIDEYNRIKERHQFLAEQQQDLIEAKETLYAVISEMDQEMERRFHDTFAQIKEEFSTVFRQLFGGGHAALTLTDPQQLLTTGVEIKAQPPGKKAQQLALLSGGERALTAIALLFAILRVRPVPFCVLDEVEAALDDANVDRFSRYLKEYSKQTQFIVITHRKGTMEGADVLYGVTMQESGVSRFVSVKLEETEALIES
ncbi:chromosome segregation protein SMC [Amphibacillus sediminis]|uniref:chromosome segregation protein SMC n=1 Tax=Amphibacillus sediminis TaxID=360185 RepID=UPI0008363491|nr:chromosome segregation protein SMC [Amphibacillus sediminis]